MENKDSQFKNPYKDPIFLFVMDHRLPIIREKDVSVRNALERYFMEMCSALTYALEKRDSRYIDDGCYNKLEELRPEIETLCNKIISVFDYYNKGETGKLSLVVDEIMEQSKPYLSVSKLSKLYPHSDEEDIPGGEIKTGYGSQSDIFIWYRMRPGKYTNQEDLFHVPWSKRSKIASGRYSIAGQPCLYLSSMPQIPWYEIGMPHEASESAFFDLPGYKYAIQRKVDKYRADLQILKDELDAGHDTIMGYKTKEYISRIQSLMLEPEKTLKDFMSQKGDLKPFRVLNFTVPFSNSGIPNASQDFVMKMLGQYNQARPNQPEFKPFNTEAERVVWEIQGAKVVYPTYTLEDVNHGIVSYIFTLPIIAACSVVVNDLCASFKEEYVFSQQVLLWVMRQDNIDGIAYRTCTKYEDSRYLNAFDVVLPADDLPIAGVEYSPKLRRAFEIRKPEYINISDHVREMEDKYKLVYEFSNELYSGMKRGWFEPYDDMQLIVKNTMLIYDALVKDAYKSGETLNANIEVLVRYSSRIMAGKDGFINKAIKDFENATANGMHGEYEADALEVVKSLFKDFENKVVMFIESMNHYVDGSVTRAIVP